VALSLAAVLAARPAIAHAFYPTDAIAANAVGHRGGRASVFSIMGIPRREGLTAQRHSLRVWRRAVSGASAIVALSAAAATAIRRELGVASTVIHPGVDLDAFRPTGARDTVPTILCNGAMEDARKRVGLLLRAFAHVRRERPDAVLLVNRPGDRRLAEEALAAGPGVELIDPTREPGGFPRLYSRAWVSALASEAEAFGLVYVEAMACGTPAVGARDGGVPEIIDRPEVGGLFDGDDPRAVARALLEALELAQDPTTAGACRQRARAFSTDVMVERHIALYDGLRERAS
jgi:glycosyltransferase involved in cell wall biosynthesis